MAQQLLVRYLPGQLLRMMASAAMRARRRTPSPAVRLAGHAAPWCRRGDAPHSAHGQPARRLTIQATTNL
jgi:hypothetical protein